MSYKNDREKMNEETQNHRKQVLSAIKITFVIFAVFLVIFCVTLLLSFAFGWGEEKDTVPPEIYQNTEVEGVEIFSGGVIAYVGDTPKFLSLVSANDDRDGNVELNVVKHNVDSAKEGTYTVQYSATDTAGNVSYFTLKYVVKSKEFAKSTLMALIAEKAEELGITKEMSKVQQVRKIYAYVNDRKTIYFTDESNIPNIDRNKWQSDWVEEAVRGIESNEGDCYTYYSLSKAFFEYFGIENYGIKRAENYEGAEDDGTHFWSAVNVGEGNNDKWYYYDATRLGGSFTSDNSRNACLITEAKLNSYRTSDGKDYFYKMTKPAGFPKIATEELD